jgi:hypothetical protein
MTTDPIQTVLEAQAVARADVEAEREAAGLQIAEAQSRARAIRERNERRTFRAIRRYEETCAARTEAEIERVREHGGRAEAHFEQACDLHLEDVIQRAVRALWQDA